jgi:hypothetical protein
MSARSWNPTFPGAWQGAGSAGLSCLFGFAQQEGPDRPNKQDKLPSPRHWYLVVREMNVQDRHI